MSNHPTDFEGLEPEELASAIASFRYDALERFLSALAEELHNDSISDLERGREHLARQLETASEYIDNATGSIGHAWTIAKKHMSQQKKNVDVGSVVVHYNTDSHGFVMDPTFGVVIASDGSFVDAVWFIAESDGLVHPHRYTKKSSQVELSTDQKLTRVLSTLVKLAAECR